MTSTEHSDPTDALPPERADLLDTLRKHRGLFRVTVADLSEEHASATPTASALSLGGLIKHVSRTEAEWARFIEHGRGEESMSGWEDIDWSNPPPAIVEYQQQFQLVDGESLEQVLAEYDEVAARTDALVATVDLDATQLLPEAPWFQPGSSWTARRVFLHIVAETAQHAGHADIIRETVDGRKTMG